MRTFSSLLHHLFSKNGDTTIGKSLSAEEILSFYDYTEMKVCARCTEVYGFWHYAPKAPLNWRKPGIYFQKCGCPSKPEMPPKEIQQEKWNGFDFNRAVTLCWCCGQEAIPSGSKFSVWHCTECKGRVIQLNTDTSEQSSQLVDIP